METTGADPDQLFPDLDRLRALIALVIIVVLFLPVLFVGVFTPMVWPAAVLAALAGWQHNRLLGTWAAVVGVIGGAEAIYVIARRERSTA
jgi:uncharacterized membrane protein YdjX (TVP38/TMEM64 family)